MSGCFYIRHLRTVYIYEAFDYEYYVNKFDRIMSSTESTETRAIIKFCANLGMTPTQTMKKMEEADMKNCACRALVFRWHKRFREGRESISDDERRGRPPVISSTLVTSIKLKIFYTHSRSCVVI